MSEKSRQMREDNMAKFIEKYLDRKLEYFGGSGEYDEENLEKAKKIVDPNEVDSDNLDVVERYQKIKKESDSDESDFS